MRYLISTAIALSTLAIPVVAQSLTEQSPPEQPHQGERVNPRRLAISVSVAVPDDLKVKEGDRVVVGDLIADRGRERQRLEGQRQQLQLTLERLQSSAISEPAAPKPVPAIAALPDASYLEQEAALDAAQQAWQLKQKELAELQAIDGLDPIVLEHEQANLKELEQIYWLEQGRLEKAQQERQYREYDHGLAQTQRVEAYNQAMLAYQRQWAEYEQRLRDRAFQVSQTRLKLDEVDNAIAMLAVVRAPYSGTVRRVEWLGQDASGMLSAEVSLLVAGDGPDANSDATDSGSAGSGSPSSDEPALPGE